MTHLSIGILLGIAIALAIFCCSAMAIMRDPLQRLQFSMPIVSISVLLIVIAVFLENGETQARIKIILIGLILFFMNSVLTHVTARAIYIKRYGHWPPEPRDRIPVHEQSKAGE